MDETRILRDRQASMEAAIDSAPSRRTACADARLVQTTQVNTYPTVAGAYYACNPVQINGPPIEGGAATYVPDTKTVIVCWNNGSQIPPQGTVLVAHYVAGRAVFSYS